MELCWCRKGSRGGWMLQRTTRRAVVLLSVWEWLCALPCLQTEPFNGLTFHESFSIAGFFLFHLERELQMKTFPSPSICCQLCAFTTMSVLSNSKQVRPGTLRRNLLTSIDAQRRTAKRKNLSFRGWIVFLAYSECIVDYSAHFCCLNVHKHKKYNCISSNTSVWMHHYKSRRHYLYLYI